MTAIRTTHVGSLPRPPHLLELIVARENGKPVDGAALQAAIAQAVGDAVLRQVETGIDIVSDGEMSKFAYSTYVKERLTGLGGEGEPRRPGADIRAFPTFMQRYAAAWGRLSTCVGPVAPKDSGLLEIDLANFRVAVDAARPHGAFLTAASPGLIASFIFNRYYPSHEAYIAALAAAMRPEYEAIVAAGFDLQLDCPDLASARNNAYQDLSDEEFAQRQHLAIDAINEATAAIPPERMRLHLCWGNYEGPHHLDLPIEKVLPIALRARPATISLEGANPRHEHEWTAFERIPLPDGKTIVPGMIDSTTNFIEHPELVAQRIERYAGVVGPERLIAGVDCGFGTSALQQTVDGEIAWAKLGALAEGAAIASRRL